MGRKGPFLWISQKNWLVRAARDTSKFITYNLPISRRRYMAEILPIRRNTQKQSINQRLKAYIVIKHWHMGTHITMYIFNNLNVVTQKWLILRAANSVFLCNLKRWTFLALRKWQMYCLQFNVQTQCFIYQHSLISSQRCTCLIYRVLSVIRPS